MKKKKIMIVDDSKTFHMFITQKLHDAFELVHIIDPMLALEEAMKTRPDLILIDLEMPVVNGFELSVIMHNNGSTSAIPVMILTSSYKVTLFNEAINAHAMDILSKNFSDEYLINKINAVMRQKELIEAEARTKQLEAVKALIAVSNHEINNALQVSYYSIHKINRDYAENAVLQSYALKMIDSNDRIKKVVFALNGLDSIDFTDYSSEQLMLKLKMD